VSVYVDDARIFARVKGGPPNGARWSHLWADSLEELEDFAALLGLNPKWLQSTSLYHYDVVETKRIRAIELGAIPIEAGSEKSGSLYSIARHYKRGREGR
jgi:hypothetical protein